ncbi:MAG: GMC family oxidoreductase N-terminal domain-containing protein [Chloroflexota bacterium]
MAAERSPRPFGRREVATLAALAETFVPGADAARVAGIAADALVRAVDPAQLGQLRLVLRLLEARLANLVTTGRAAGFGAMSLADREALLLGWAGSAIAPQRSAFHAFRKLLTFIAYADPGDAGSPNPLPGAVGYAPDAPPVTADLAHIRPHRLDRSAGPAMERPVELEADVIVVGSGAGGGVMAAELARAGRSVLVIEAGPFVDEATMPRDELDAYGRVYLNYGLLSTWDGSITLLAGSGVGGGTLVNWMTCIDVPGEVRAEWAGEHGLDGLDGPEWDRDVAAIESELGVAPAQVVPPKDRLILQGTAALGWEADRMRRNAVDCGDCGSCPFGCPRGTKQSGIRAHLAVAAARGARVVDRARVTRVVVEGGRVTGVSGNLLVDPRTEADSSGPSGRPAGPAVRPFLARAPQVVLAAGALRSPAILQASAVRHPGIGRYLRIHPVPVIGAVMADPVDMWRGTMQAVRSVQFAAGQPDRRGYIIESAPGHLGLLALIVPWEGRQEHAAIMARARHFAPLVAVTRDGGEGRTSLTRAGRVRIDYRLDDLGRATLRHALVAMANIARAGGAEEILGVGVPLLRHRTEWRDEANRFRAFERQLAERDFGPHRGTVASAHQMGTIRMGADAADHPADERGRIRADGRGRPIAGLYVADTSTFPTAIGVNPMIAVLAMARRVSRTVLGEGAPPS